MLFMDHQPGHGWSFINYVFMQVWRIKACVCTFLVQQHHDTVSMGVAVEMPSNNITVLPKDGNQSLVVYLSDGSDVSGKGKVTHRYMGYDVHLEQVEGHV